MFSRATSSVRTAARLARPASATTCSTLPARSAVAVAYRSYSAESDKSAAEASKPADAESEKVKALETKIQDLEVSFNA